MTSALPSSERPVESQPEQGSPQTTSQINSTETAKIVDQSPPMLSGQEVVHGMPASDAPVQVIMTQDAMRGLEKHCYSVLDSELGGVLLGKIERDQDINYLRVNAVLPVQTDDRGPVHFTFTADSWAQLHENRQNEYPYLDIVGWYHTHPGLGVFYSEDDVVVHSAAFVMPWHVGLVIDPLSNQGCFFAWHRSTLSSERPVLGPLSGYYEEVEEDGASVSSWRFVDANIWQSDTARPESPALSNQVFIAANDWPALPPISPWWGVLLGGVSLILTLLLLLDRLIALVG